MELIMMIVFAWMLLGVMGFYLWLFEAYIKDIRIIKRDWVLLFFFMLVAGFFGLILSFLSIEDYIEKV